MCGFGCELALCRVPVRGAGRTVESMNDAQTPRIRDPHAAVNLVGSGAAQPDSSSNVVDPLAALGPVAGSDASASTSGSLRDFRPLDMDDADGASEIYCGLAWLDPLTVRPRISSRVLCVVFGLLLIAIGFGVWWGCVFTENGQSYDELVWKNLHNNVPSWATGVMNAVAQSWLVIAVSCTIAAIGIITAPYPTPLVVGRVYRRVRRGLLGRHPYQRLLPRPFIINTESPAANSAPSGHTILAAACAVILLLTVPRAVRALAGVIGVVWAVTVGVSVIYGQWHRPSDVAMSILLVAGLALLALAVTRKSGMDEPGRRVSSVSVQIVGSVLITGGLLLLAYSGYVIWQVVPGLNVSASWAVQGANVSAVVGIAGVAMLAFGLLLALRQITAAPLSRLGLIGAPPAPPKR